MGRGSEERFFVSREEFLEAVRRNRAYYASRVIRLEGAGRSGCFEAIGCRQRLFEADHLYHLLLRGGVPSVMRVVGYFGRGVS